MCHDVYNSPAPTSFIRSGTKRKASYGHNEYFKLVLTSEIASGATGVVHGAQLEVHVDGNILRTGVVVKLAFAPEEIEGMRHEFTIYEHLTSRGVVEGIPLMFGLFEDVETDAMALVMDHVGRSLWDLRPDSNAVEVKVSAHIRAGVRHGDLRPENLMITDNENVTVIDFDQATIHPTSVAKKREIALLFDLMKGGTMYNPR
ncbi:hypothetical protein H0H87_003096 [Tephrocybe sp. NHM501043]|nr:hypothetical protein H0H87_003096 [Tephrocybe sp. NHM501043]